MVETKRDELRDKELLEKLKESGKTSIRLLNATNPLWMPQGSVRAIIALTLITMTAGMFYGNVEIPEWFTMLVVSSISFYFGTRKATISPE